MSGRDRRVRHTTLWRTIINEGRCVVYVKADESVSFREFPTHVEACRAVADANHPNVQLQMPKPRKERSQ